MKLISNLSANLSKALSRRMHDLWRPAGPSAAAACTRSAFSEGAWVMLRAASKLYEKGLQKDQARLGKRRLKLPVPVISIGNLSTGGTGKTPLTIWMCEFLLATGYHPAVLTRGYGRRGGNPGPVPPIGDAAELSEYFGDEPVMMSAYLPAVPVWVGRDRAASGRAALAQGTVDVLILDDGFQHLALERDLDIVLLDCRSPFGNGHVLPAGPLREPPSSLKRAHAFLITHVDDNSDSAPLAGELQRLFPAIEVFACRHRFRGIGLRAGGPVLALDAFRDRRAVVFAGIGGPEGFFEDLRRAGIKTCRTFAFPDHHRYAASDLSMIFRAASEHNAGVIITTAKDWVRIPAPFRGAFTVAEIVMDLGGDREGFCNLVAGAMHRCQIKK